ncbi:Brp/Blh family beta-carotene 15,15'-dioxygenase [Halonotius pteroides]|uniref:Probable beta-carotene 15,15'-dioxygenase n=1 Tax=Halonotius pteroides TaxID=268735 RepID=A0A3A6PYP7_9EURY|nr:Brp/Blh family beta-carotene 15,15'-dioxygenase [Halonotius pteroides]RJX49204.1 beta-carotene 15,15'-dioxygenase [Halonotius pteroides]
MSALSARAISRLSHRTDNHPSLLLSRAALLVVAVTFATLAAAGLSVPMEAQMISYLVGMIALNLPHGGYEHVANLRRRRPEFRWRYVGVYLAAVGGFLGLLLVAPVAGLTLAVTVAMAKGGLGGVRVLDVTSGTDHLRTRAQRLLAAGVRGGSVMLVPIVFWPETFHSFSALMVGLVEPGGLAPYAAYFHVTRPVIAGGYGLALVAHIGLGYLRGGGRSWLVDAGESLLLTAYFAVVPVVVAVGLYFPLWYSARQVARAQSVDTAGVGNDRWDLLGGDDPTTTAIRAWGLLVAGAMATVAVLAVVYWAVPNPFADSTLLAGAVAFWSIFISIIALPHVVVGSLWDRERGIWYVP